MFAVRFDELCPVGKPCKTPARNWIVYDLLDSHRVILSWEKTGKTSTSSTTNNNWNVNVQLKEGKTRSSALQPAVPPTAAREASFTSTGKILGTSITCSGSSESARRKWRISGNCTTICGAGSSRVGNEGFCCPVRRYARSCGPDTAGSRSGRPPPRSSSNDNSKSSGWGVGVPDRGRVVQLVPPHPGPGIRLSP